LTSTFAVPLRWGWALDACGEVVTASISEA
jgi:hypothetical protein